VSALNRASALGRVARIREMAGDSEAAHAAEDDLWQDVLEAIRDGAENPGELAAIALRTADMEFPRWYA
jgi:hypothetical protein